MFGIKIQISPQPLWKNTSLNKKTGNYVSNKIESIKRKWSTYTFQKIIVSDNNHIVVIKLVANVNIIHK